MNTPVEVVMPKLGLTMTEGTVTRWLKAEGDPVVRGESLFEFETDKSTLEVESPASGVLSRILAPEGTIVPVLQPVARIASTSRAEAMAPALHPQASALSADHGTGAQAHVPEARAPAPPGIGVHDPIKATPKARRLAKDAGLDLSLIQGTGPGGRIVAEDVECAVAAQATPRDHSPVPARTVAAALAAPGAEARPEVRASPVARRLAEEAGLDLSTVAGTGRDSRIMREDVERALASKPAPPQDRIGAPKTRVTVPLSGIRGVIARRMAASAHTAAAVTNVTQVDATELIRIRTALREEWAAPHGFGPSYNDLLLVILAKALGEFPYMNAHLVGDEIRHLEEINIGLAVDTERGLVVPVVMGLAGRPLVDVSCATRDLVARAQAGTLLPDDLSGGTFTLSNLGMFEVDAFTPIINLPECAILGIGRIVDQPAVVREGDAEGGQATIRIRPMMTLSLTFDHRAIDGAPAARFLQRVRQLIEEPYRLF